ncbi:hypothetical protein MCP1_150001 [Candidatus Terasakiella magnetica]|nr:hypothetical protein MCP1_150001 [Candidatus Terasakiella magnetica]
MISQNMNDQKISRESSPQDQQPITAHLKQGTSTSYDQSHTGWHILPIIKPFQHGTGIGVVIMGVY